MNSSGLMPNVTSQLMLVVNLITMYSNCLVRERGLRHMLESYRVVRPSEGAGAVAVAAAGVVVVYG